MKIHGSAKSNCVALLARQIAQRILETPALFVPLADVIYKLKGHGNQMERRIDVLLQQPIQEYPEEAAELKTLLIKYFTTDYAKWDFDKRRGYLLEEIVASLKPESFGFQLESTIQCYREGKLYGDDNQPLCGHCDLDVIFTDDKRFEGIECKVKLSSWLSYSGGLTSDAEAKLTYIGCLRQVLAKHGYCLGIHFATFDDTFPYQDLSAYSYSFIGILNTNSLDNAIKRNKSLTTKMAG